jgi:uncharacterized protein (DUF58 family)
MNKKKAKEIILRAKKDVFSGNLGNHLTLFKGDGLDFREIRDYTYGDDIRKINWLASAKGSGLKVNEFNEERELNIVIVLMLSGGLHFGSVKLKHEVAIEILALLGLSAIKDNNRVETIFFEKEMVRLFKPTKREAIIYDVVEKGVAIEPLGMEADYNSLVESIMGLVKQRSIIFVIGDFLTQDLDFSLISAKHQIYALVVRDHLEESLELFGEYQLIDTNSLNSEDFLIDKSVIASYKAELEKHDRALREHFLKHGVVFGKVYTDDEVYIRLSQIIKE